MRPTQAIDRHTRCGRAASRRRHGDVRAGKEAVHYELAPVREGIWAVSYLSKGYTLTTVLDFDSMTLVAFSSNDKTVAVQHGTFDEVEATVSGSEARPH